PLPAVARARSALPPDFDTYQRHRCPIGVRKCRSCRAHEECMARPASQCRALGGTPSKGRGCRCLLYSSLPDICVLALSSCPVPDRRRYKENCCRCCCAVGGNNSFRACLPDLRALPAFRFG